jgi:uncharacterized membrane protein YkoI
MLNTVRSRIAAASTALVLVGAFALPAYAQSNTNQPELSLSQIESRLSGQGFRVIEIERDDGLYEVKAFNNQNTCVELHVNRSSGEIVRSESDDDCHGDDHNRRGGRSR